MKIYQGMKLAYFAHVERSVWTWEVLVLVLTIFNEGAYNNI